jgi:hypothetical protein
MKNAVDQPVFAHIGRLVDEEHRLFDQGGLSQDDSRRLAALQADLDRCWDLLR